MPNKIKSFAWRACRNILPTKANLHSRKLTPDSICEECGAAVESSGHVFWHCARAKEVWSAANVEFGADVEFGEFLDLVWFARNVKQWSAQALAGLCTIAWGIWFNWNEVRIGGARKSASAIARWSMDYLEEFQVANHKIQVKKPETQAGWIAPHPPCLKINVDGAVFERQRSVGIGVVVRDHFGVVRAALSKKFLGLLGPLETEAKAMEEGLHFASNLGVCATICEGDSTVVYNSLTGSINPPASICNLINGSLLQATRFGECKFSVVPRSGNKVAHGLAQYAKNLSDKHGLEIYLLSKSSYSPLMYCVLPFLNQLK